MPSVALPPPLPFRLLLVALSLGAVLLCSPAAASDPPVAASGSPAGADEPVVPAGEISDAEARLQAEVEQLIAMLGDPSYARRERASRELEQLGLLAFDALHEARFHDDSEVAMAARYLVSSLQVNWASEADPPPVREILDEYGAQAETERKSRIDLLSRLPDRQGLTALCRLARFETSLWLSREAALRVMQMPEPSSPERRRAEAARVRQSLGPNTRQASQWLRAYAADLAEGTFNADLWQRLIAAERARVIDNTKQPTDARIVLELYRISATRALRLGDEETATDLAMNSLELVLPEREGLLEASNWAIDTGLHPAVLALATRQPERFQSDPQLLYALAEAHLAAGDAQEAEAVAAKALAHESLPDPAAEETRVESAEVELRAYRHTEVGVVLRNRGRFDWAEREFRHVIERLPLDSVVAIQTRAQLADMLGKLDRHAAVVEVLGPLVDRIENDRQLQRRLSSQMILSPEFLMARMHFHAGQQAAEEGREEEAREQLRQAIGREPQDVDILIAMFRQEGDARWEADTRAKIHALATNLETRIQQAERGRRGGRRPDTLELAHYCNQYAWLVANTVGDYSLALRYSHQSLELMPDEPAFLDTLARCYYANGELDQAITTQRRALEGLPHDPELQRQLEYFLGRRDATSDAAPEQLPSSVEAAEAPES